jgi:hypothetical protein
VASLEVRVGKLSGKEGKGKEGLWGIRVAAARIPLPTSPSFNPSCLHHVGPESGISSTVDVPILPRKEKRGRGVCLQILCLPTLTCTTGNPSMINTDRIPIKHQ